MSNLSNASRGELRQIVEHTADGDLRIRASAELMLRAERRRQEVAERRHERAEVHEIQPEPVPAPVDPALNRERLCRPL